MKFFKRFNDIDQDYLLTDKHIHSAWTDGQGSIFEIAQAADAIGLKHIAITDHIRAGSTYFDDYADEIKQINTRVKTDILTGFEAKVKNFEGDIDAPEHALEKADIRIASVHRFPSQDGPRHPGEYSKEDAQKIEFELCMAVLKNKNCNVLGHAGGMSLNVYNEFNMDFFEKIISECALKNTAFELNNAYHEPILEGLKALLKKYNPFVSIGSDAHSPGELKDLGYLVK